MVSETVFTVFVTSSVAPAPRAARAALPGRAVLRYDHEAEERRRHARQGALSVRVAGVEAQLDVFERRILGEVGVPVRMEGQALRLHPHHLAVALLAPVCGMAVCVGGRDRARGRRRRLRLRLGGGLRRRSAGARPLRRWGAAGGRCGAPRGARREKGTAAVLVARNGVHRRCAPHLALGAPRMVLNRRAVLAEDGLAKHPARVRAYALQRARWPVAVAAAARAAGGPLVPAKAPSPRQHEALAAAHALGARHWLQPEPARALAVLDPAAARVRLAALLAVLPRRGLHPPDARAAHRLRVARAQRAQRALAEASPDQARGRRLGRQRGGGLAAVAARAEAP
mmetsp:Transcript_59788/g.161118  ORF Transcript_59788/g.161118 Transcript_59788/m.161118 type:complete len:341 (-) Transcript_59788:227-1249(-)